MQVLRIACLLVLVAAVLALAGCAGRRLSVVDGGRQGVLSDCGPAG